MSYTPSTEEPADHWHDILGTKCLRCGILQSDIHGDECDGSPRAKWRNSYVPSKEEIERAYDSDHIEQHADPEDLRRSYATMERRGEREITNDQD